MEKPTTPIKKKRSWLFRLARVVGVLLLVLVALIYFIYVLPFWGIPFNQSRHGRVPLTPPWALECWLWEDDVNTEAYVKELLEGYAKYDLPVRTILIDSPWSWQYNDFKLDDNRYPEPEKFFRGLKSQGYRVVFWMTCMVNSQSKDTRLTESRDFYELARSRGYLAGRGYQVKWWKGKGGFIDYTDPDAMKWWHGLQNQVLDWGADGWKLDGCDTFFSGKFGKLIVPFNRTHSGWMTTRQYMDHYARDELHYGQTQNPEFVIMVRALDQPWSHPEGFSPLDAATVTWVGDNRHTWKYKERGIEGAISDILNSATHLLQLINDVLDLSKVEAGRMEILQSTFRLDEVIVEVVQNITPIMSVKGLKLVRDIPQDLAPITTDRRKLLQILLNLASNAVKFTDHGEVTLRCQISAGTMRLSVSDTGIGIKPAELPRLFQPFSQIDDSLQKRHEGTGLGLYLSGRLATLLRGDLTVESEYGKGSTFTLTLPCAN